MNIIKDRRIGRFRISLPLINDQPASCMALLSKVLVLKAELSITDDLIEYVAICDAFSEVRVGDVIPCYRPELRANYDAANKVTSFEIVTWGQGFL